MVICEIFQAIRLKLEVDFKRFFKVQLMSVLLLRSEVLASRSNIILVVFFHTTFTDSAYFGALYLKRYVLIFRLVSARLHVPILLNLDKFATKVVFHLTLRNIRKSYLIEECSSL